MPELPEVETVRLQLLDNIKGKIISKVDILPGAININSEIISKALAKVKDIKRRAKLLIVELDNGYSLIIHLKLTGYFYFQKQIKTDKFTRVIFYFKGGEALLFEDVRKFGFIKLSKTSEVNKYLERESYGVEPLSKEFTLDKFKQILNYKKKLKIKPMLMEQTSIAGIGNVYAQEACWYAKIKPTRVIGSLNDKEIKRLYEIIPRILQESIECRGSSVDTYVDIFGKQGEFAPMRLKVYGKDKCGRDGSKLKKMTLGGRGTSYCEKCQK